MRTIAFITDAGNDNSPHDEPYVAPDANALSGFIADASPGATIAYHIGELARDRYRPLSQLSDDQLRELSVLADYAQRLADAGWVHLVQRRLGAQRFAYLLIVRTRSRVTRRQELPLVRVMLLEEAA